MRDGGDNPCGPNRDVLNREPDDPDPLPVQPLRPPPVMLDLLGMHRPVDLDAELRLRTIEIEDVRPDRMLPPEVRALPVAAQHMPKRTFRLGHCAAQRLRPLLRQDRCSHGPVLVAAPSTTLRVVPLPRFAGEDADC